MRKLIPLILLAACGPKTSESVKQPPPPTDPVTEPAKPPPSDPDAALVAEAKQFAAATEADLRKLNTDASVAAWANATDITPEHEEAAAKAGAELSKGITRLIKASRKFEPVMGKLDADTRRQLTLLKFAGQPAPEDPKAAEELTRITTEMESIYGKGKVCRPGKGGKEVCKDLEEVSKILEKPKTADEALAAWQGWHDNVGRAERDLFVKYVALANTGARAVGFQDVAAQWRGGYDMTADAFESDVDRLFAQVKPLYDQLHCYARRKLNKKYGDKAVPKTGPMPAHLLGNMWAQDWSYVYKELEPFPGQPAIDVTDALVKQGYDGKKMVKVAEAFYMSLGFPALPDTFWERSMFAKPPGKEAVCHASAWDVTFSNDLRIKMCIQPKQEDLRTIHHELGHNYYYASYYKLPILYQGGANDGFHEAIGDTVQLSMTPEYLKEKGLLDKVVKNDKQTLNYQMKTALEKIAFLPFGLVIDKWRWDVFSGKVAPEKYNDRWWELRRKYQGVMPAVARAATDFDPGAKYHVPANVPYIRYFLAHILQFQFHRALCAKAGFKGPLHECSIYGSKPAGEAYWKMLSLGQSKPWQDALAELTGSREMDATAVLEYFAPLKAWLEEQNNGQTCGW